MSSFIFTSCKNDETKKDIHSSIDNNKKNEVINESNNIRTDSNNLIGVWNWRSDDKSQAFTIKIKKIDKDSVFGQYCAVYNNGNKIDCDVDDINNIKGLIIKNKIQLNFNSFFGAKDGLAEITIIDNSELKWKITKDPKGEFYAPSECILKPKKNLEIKNNDKIINLPFDFENLKNCSQNCSQIYPQYTSEELPNIAKIAFEITQYEPEIIYLLNNGNLKFQTYIVQYSGDAISQTLINIKNDKAVSSEDIGYELGAEDESYLSFIINEKLNIDIIDINYKTKLKKVLNTFKINSEGKIIKIK